MSLPIPMAPSAGTEPPPLLRSRCVPWALALALALAAVATPAPAQRVARVGDYIVAVVNSDLVTAFEVEQRMALVREQVGRTGARQPQDDALRKQVVDALIEDRVVVTFARENGPKVDEAELDRAVAAVAAQNQLSLEQLRDRLRSEGSDLGRFRSSLRDQILVERVREREVNGRIRITDADVDRLVEKRRADAAAEGELNIAQILVTVPDGAAPAQEQPRRERAEAALKRLKAGEDFAAVAREVSEDANREKGGEIGPKLASRLPDLFVDAVKTLAPGQSTPELVRSGAGFHILKLIARSEGQAFKTTQTRARHILLRPSERADAAALVQRMEGLRRQIDRRERRFEDVARELSEDGSGPNGGDLGWASAGTFVPEFEEALNKLDLNGLSEPVVSRFGVHLIQVLERRDVALDIREVRDQARNQLREQRFEAAFGEWARELRQRAYVELREPPL